jgi:hypothetical protein
VRNEADGSVLIEVQGTGAAIEAFLADLRGRMGRFISRETPAAIAAVADEQGFEIRYEGRW